MASTSTSPATKKLQQALTRLTELNEFKTNLFAAGKKDGTSYSFDDLKSVLDQIKAQELEIKELEKTLEKGNGEKAIEVDPEIANLTQKRDLISKDLSSLRNEIVALDKKILDLQANSKATLESF